MTLTTTKPKNYVQDEPFFGWVGGSGAEGEFPFFLAPNLIGCLP